MTPSWVIIAVPAGTFAACVATRAGFLALRRRSSDREWAAGIASQVHDREYLDWLEDEFAKTNGGRT